MSAYLKSCDKNPGPDAVSDLVQGTSGRMSLENCFIRYSLICCSHVLSEHLIPAGT